MRWGQWGLRADVQGYQAEIGRLEQVERGLGQEGPQQSGIGGQALPDRVPDIGAKLAEGTLGSSRTMGSGLPECERRLGGMGGGRVRSLSLIG